MFHIRCLLSTASHQEYEERGLSETARALSDLQQLLRTSMGRREMSKVKGESYVTFVLVVLLVVVLLVVVLVVVVLVVVLVVALVVALVELVT